MALLCINPYNEVEFWTPAKKQKYEQRVRNTFNTGDRIQFGYSTFADADMRSINPRDRFLTPMFGMGIFRYYDIVAEKSPATILDIGCGMNIFKKFYPQVHGIDNDQKFAGHADEIIAFNHQYAVEHAGTFDSVVAFNSLYHDHVGSLTASLLDVDLLLAPGGRACVTLPVKGMVNRTNRPDQFIEYLGTAEPTSWQLAEFFDQTIRQLPFNWLVVENYVGQTLGDLNGSLRMIWEKPL